MFGCWEFEYSFDCRELKILKRIYLNKCMHTGKSAHIIHIQTCSKYTDTAWINAIGLYVKFYAQFRYSFISWPIVNYLLCSILMSTIYTLRINLFVYILFVKTAYYRCCALFRKWNKKNQSCRFLWVKSTKMAKLKPHRPKGYKQVKYFFKTTIRHK